LLKGREGRLLPLSAGRPVQDHTGTAQDVHRSAGTSGHGALAIDADLRAFYPCHGGALPHRRQRRRVTGPGKIGDQVAESPPASFAALLRKLRMDAGLTQEKLAEAAKVSYRSVSDLERGVNHAPRRETDPGLPEPAAPGYRRLPGG
jgi:DNA-binding XRE family transcriptional regulator